MNTTVSSLTSEVRKELIENILPYWMNRMVDPIHKGFYGRITGAEVVMPHSEKGAILNARILWTFSSAYRLLKQEEYLTIATRAKRYLIDYFYDSTYGGIYWSLNELGEPLQTKKQIYAIGFAIYGLSEYHRTTNDAEALEYAIRLFHSIETHSFDQVKNGYCEALTRQWDEIADMRLSEKDANECKTMNTHLHILESYTNLYRVWHDESLKKQLRNLIELFMYNIVDKESYHLQLFFDEEWQSKCPIISYGHDIEASWLLHEAALVLGDSALLAEVEPTIRLIARAATEGIGNNHGMIYEKHSNSGHSDEELHWWVQAEAVVGYFNIYQHWGSEEALLQSASTWAFIKNHLIDHKYGEWFWSIRPDGAINRSDDKAGFWKCPYHNGRMCMELIERME